MMYPLLKTKLKCSFGALNEGIIGLDAFTSLLGINHTLHSFIKLVKTLLVMVLVNKFNPLAFGSRVIYYTKTILNRVLTTT